MRVVKWDSSVMGWTVAMLAVNAVDGRKKASDESSKFA